MDYKEKLVELMTKCLNDEKLYELVIDQVDEYRCTPQSLAYKKVSAIYCGPFNKRITYREEYYYNNVKCRSIAKMKEKYELFDLSKYSEDKILPDLQISFEQHPSLILHCLFAEKSEKTNINIPYKRFFFFNGPKQHVIKTTYTNIPSYIIQQGSLKAELTPEEANVLIELYKTNNKKFEEKRDLEKLEARLKQYKK